MGNILFQNNQVPQKLMGNSILDMISSLKGMGPSEAVFQNMYASNPDFRVFADSVRNVGPDQAFKQNGLDFNQFRQFKW